MILKIVHKTLLIGTFGLFSSSIFQSNGHNQRLSIWEPSQNISPLIPKCSKKLNINSTFAILVDQENISDIEDKFYNI